MFEPLPGCDHEFISATCSFKIVKQMPYKRLMWDFAKADFQLFRTLIWNHDWTLTTSDIDTEVFRFTTNLFSLAKDVIPNKLVTIRQTDKPWYNSYLRRLK